MSTTLLLLGGSTLAGTAVLAAAKALLPDPPTEAPSQAEATAPIQDRAPTDTTAPNTEDVATPQAAVLAPMTWDQFVGQPRATDELMVRAQSAKERQARMEHTLLVGPPGTGKTTLAKLIAGELDRPMVEISRPPSNTDDLASALVGFEQGVLFVDEVHLFSKRQQHDLMDLTESGALQTSTGRISYPDLTVIAATTEKHKLVGPLRGARFGSQPAWEDYTQAEMVQIVRGMADRADLSPETVTDSFCEGVATAAAGVPRSARALVLAARDMEVAGRDVDVSSVLQFAGVEPDGLTLDQLRYLRTLANAPDRRAGLMTLSTVLEVAQDEVRQIERVLIRRRYVNLTPSGRQLTSEGLTRIGGDDSHTM